jgi:DNA-binding transcriptional LysR family regulator
MDIRDIEAFVVVTQLHSVTAAAEKLHLTQPAVSRRLQRIEEELGVALFERLGTKMVLTPPGDAFLRRSISLIADLKEAVREAQLAAGRPASFSIGMVGTLAGTEFASKFGFFRDQQPGVDVHLRTARSDEIGEMVASGELDVGLRYFSDNKVKNVEQVRVGEERFVIIASSKNDSFSYTSSVDDLAGFTWVSFPREGASGSTFTHTLDALLLLHRVQEGTRMTVDSLTALKRLVEAGFGLGYVPVSSIVEEVHLGTLKTIRVPSFEANAPIYALYRKSSAVLPLIQSFSNVLTQDWSQKGTSQNE